MEIPGSFIIYHKTKNEFTVYWTNSEFNIQLPIAQPIVPLPRSEAHKALRGIKHPAKVLGCKNYPTKSPLLNISSKDISVVLQGPIYGQEERSSRRKITLRCLASIRKILPESEIILSTWKGSNIQGLPFNRLVESEDPGAPLTLADGKSTPFNVNRMIVSTLNGLRAANRPFAMKLRTDTELLSDNFLKFFEKFPQRSDQWKILERRVLNLTVYARNPRLNVFPSYCFHPSDIAFFGLRDDLLKIWNVPLATAQEADWFQEPLPTGLLYSMTVRYHPEQHIWLNFLRQHGEVPFELNFDRSPESIRLSELTIANNLILLSPTQWGIRWLKAPHMKFSPTNVYTHTEWIKLYNLYCGGSAEVPFALDHFLYRKCHFDTLTRVFSSLKINSKTEFHRLFPRLYLTFRPIYQRLIEFFSR